MYHYLYCFFYDTANTEIYSYGHTLSLHDALPISHQSVSREATYPAAMGYPRNQWYVAAFSREVQSGSPLRRVLLDTPVLLYRTEAGRSEEHTSGLQSLMQISSAVFCLKKQITSLK